jgi:hypothetical protein
LTFRLADQPEETGEVSITALPLPEEVPITSTAEKKSGPLAVLDPVFHFVGSFSFGEKFLVIVGLTGLLLLYTYLGS